MKASDLWQSIEMLPVAENRVHEMVTEAERALENLEAMNQHPHTLELATIERLLDTYETKAKHLQFLKTEALYWRQADYVTERQHTLLDSLEQALSLAEKVIKDIIELARHFLCGTMDAVQVEENVAWMKAILTGKAEVPISLKEELTILKATADTLTLFQQETIMMMHEQMLTLQADGASEADYLHALRDYLPAMQELLSPEKHDALVYYCCLYPGFNEAMRLLEAHENERALDVITEN